MAKPLMFYTTRTNAASITTATTNNLKDKPECIFTFDETRVNTELNHPKVIKQWYTTTKFASQKSSPVTKITTINHLGNKLSPFSQVEQRSHIGFELRSRGEMLTTWWSYIFHYYITKIKSIFDKHVNLSVSQYAYYELGS